MADGADDILSRLHSSGLPVGEAAPAANCCRTHGENPGAGASRYLIACHHQRWKLATWSKTNPASPVTWRPARCMSWRHAGPCARAKAAQDYVRIKEALGRHERSNIVYMVLTLDPSAWDGTGWKKWNGKTPDRKPDATVDNDAIAAAYVALVDRWTQFAKALRRKWGQFEYVATVESHRSGWPHLNVVAVAPELAKKTRNAHDALPGWGRKSAGREVAKRIIGDVLERTGFGRIAFLESALALESDGEDRLAAYISKLAGDTGAAWDGQKRGLLADAGDAPAGAIVHSIEGQVVGEIAKLSQAPVRAPDNFKRLRSSPGFLPKVKKNEDLTGAIFDERGEPVGQDGGDTMIAAALRANTPDSKEELSLQISALIDKYEERGVFDGEEGELLRLKQSRMVGKLRRAIRIIQGTEPRQLLDKAKNAQDEDEKAFLLDMIEAQLEQFNEHRKLCRRNKKTIGFEDRPPVMLSEQDARRLRDARKILRGEVEPAIEPMHKRVLAPMIAREIASREDVQAVTACFGGGPGMKPTAQKYKIGDRYYQKKE